MSQIQLEKFLNEVKINPSILLTSKYDYISITFPMQYIKELKNMLYI